MRNLWIEMHTYIFVEIEINAAKNTGQTLLIHTDTVRERNFRSTR